jgi:gas vesicle protein
MAENGSNGFSWFLSGLGIGALIGVLYAPKSGRETREELVANAVTGKEYVKQRSREVGSQVGEYVETGKAKATEYVETGKARATEYVDRGKDYIETGKARLNDAVEQGRSLINEQKEKAAAAYVAGKDAYLNTTTHETGSPILAVDEPV